MKITSYRQQYETAFLQLWNEELYLDDLDVSVLRKQVLFDENFDPELCLLALKEDQLVGFLLGIKRRVPYLDRGLEPEKAWISTMAVAKQEQHLGVGSALLEEIEQRFINLGVKNCILASYSPNYFFPGVDVNAYPHAYPFLENRGYHLEEGADSMHRSLFDYRMSDEWIQKRRKAEAKGYHFMKFTYSYALKLLDFLGKEFGGGWKKNALGVTENGEGEEVIWIIVDASDDVVGFCMRKMDGCDHRFGPFGVSESLRSMGLGGILFELMMQDMKRRKLYHLYFLWTHGPGTCFYQRHGVEVYRHFLLGKKELKGKL